MSYDYQCSLPAYNQAKKRIDYTRQAVLLAIKSLGRCTDKQIATKLGWEINKVTPRRGELVTAGQVESAFKARDLESGVTVNYWQIRVIISGEFKQVKLF